MVKTLRKNAQGFTLVEVIVVAVIVAVLALVAIQLYQGYVRESRQNTAENLAASAASFLQSIVNSRDAATADGLGNLTGGQSWNVNLGSATGTQIVTFTCPANATITITAPTVSAAVSQVSSTGTYNYR